jgi:hypothetical protein
LAVVEFAHCWAILNGETQFFPTRPDNKGCDLLEDRIVKRDSVTDSEVGMGHLVDQVRPVRTSLNALAIDSREYGRPEFVIPNSIKARSMKRIAGPSGTFRL